MARTARLLEVLDGAEAGQDITITRHGKRVARVIRVRQEETGSADFTSPALAGEVGARSDPGEGSS